MIRSDAGRCPVSAQCGILGVAKSTCYWVLEHPEAERADPYEKDVERVWRDSGKVYGCFASMFVRQVRQCFSVVWADGFPRCRHRFPVM